RLLCNRECQAGSDLRPGERGCDPTAGGRLARRDDVHRTSGPTPVPPSNFQVQAAGYNNLGLTVECAPDLPFSGTAVSKAWASRNWGLLRRVLAAQAKSIEYFYDDRNRAEVVRILVAVSSQKADDVEKSYDFFRKNNFFDRTGKISRAKLNALLDALVGLGDVPARGNVDRFLLP